MKKLTVLAIVANYFNREASSYQSSSDIKEDMEDVAI